LRITGVFGVGLLNDTRQILPRPTLVAMAANLGTKSAKVGLYTIFLGDLCIQKVFFNPFGVGLSSDVRQIVTGLTQVTMGTKFEIKLSISRLVYKTSRRSLRPIWGFQSRAIE